MHQGVITEAKVRSSDPRLVSLSQARGRACATTERGDGMRIFRYELQLDVTQTIDMPLGYKLLSVAQGAHDYTIDLWAQVPEEASMVPVDYRDRRHRPLDAQGHALLRRHGSDARRLRLARLRAP